MNIKQIVAAALTLVALTSPTWADHQNIMGNGERKTYTLKAGDDLGVMGNLNTLTIKGDAQKISVMGNENTLTVDALVKKLDVLGNNNTVIILRREGRKDPLVNQVGTNNKVNFQKAK